MKKYLIAGTLASVLGGLFASCQHDEIAGSLVEAKVEAYKEVFKQEFGTIDSNQDWGFGTSTQSGISTARTRAINPTHVFATAPATTDYKSDVPDEGVTYVGDLGSDIYNGIQENGSYLVDGNVNYNMDFGKAVISLYVKGTITPTNLYLKAGSTLYLTSGSKLILGHYSFGQTGVKVYVASGATIECTGDLLQFSNSLLYNAGTIKAKSIQAAGGGHIYNQGTFELSNEISVENNNSEIVNDGTITAARLHTAGSGHVQNNGDLTISGNTDIDSNNNTWVNNGHYRTQYFNYIAGSNDVINNCFLTVDEDFNINHADNAGDFGFRMDTGAGVLTKNFYGGATKENKPGSGPFYITMGSGSVFKVTNDAYMNATRPNYGIYGPSTGDVYAVFQAKDIKTSNINQGFDVTYGGKLAIVADTHFDSNTGFTSNDGQADHPIIAFANGCSKDNIYINGSYPNFSIAASTCNPGFGSITIPTDDPTTGKVKVETTTEVYTTTQLIEQGRVFCEDLGRVSRNDLDFNDVVFDAYIYEVKEYTKATVKKGGTIFSENEVLNSTSYKANIILLAAGGTYPLTVAGTEVHTALGASSTNVIVNTCSSDEDAYSNPYINTSSAKDLGYIDGISSIKDIPVIVKYTDAVHELSAEVGEAPQKFCINAIGTKWAKERKQIKEAYTSFKDWVNNSSIKFWDGDKNESLLYNCSWDTYTNRSTEIVSETKSSTTVETEEDGATTGGYDNGPVLTRRNH